MDIYTGETVLFREGDVASAVRASMNLPGVSSPWLTASAIWSTAELSTISPSTRSGFWARIGFWPASRRVIIAARGPRRVLETLEQVIDIRGALLSREQRKQRAVPH